MEIKKGYKQTELGVIPEDWEVRTLGDSLEEKPKYGINAAAVPYDSSLPAYIRITDISEEGRFIKENRASVICSDYDKYQLQENDIVFARTGASTGKSYLYNNLDGKLVYAGFLIRTRINEEIAVPRYIKACVETARFKDWVKMTCTRSGQPGINGNEYASFKIPIPPISEQQAIATALSDIDGLINSLQTLIDKKKNIKQGAMQILLTGKRRLEGFSGEWVEVQLGNIAEVTMGQSPDSRFYNNNNAGIPLVQGNADIENRKTILKNYTSQITKKAKKADIIMTVRAPVGYIGKASYDCCVGRGVCSIRYRNDYLYYYLVFIENTWSTLSKGSTFDSVNSKEVNELDVIIPPTNEEQTVIANILSDMDSEIEALERKLDKFKDIKQGMMQELLTGRIRLVEEAV